MSQLPILADIEASFDQNGTITDEAFDYLIECLDMERKVMVMAALILTSLPKSFILKLVTKFPSLREEAKIALIPLLGSIEDCHEVYQLLFEQLRDAEDPTTISLIVKTLGSTDYLTFPILIFYLKTADLVFTKRLKAVIIAMGLGRLAPLLAIFPEIPEEAIFRDAFGDPAIDAIYQRK